MATLECSSKGDKRFSAFFARTSVFDKENSIENFYQLGKIFRLPNGEVYKPSSVKEIKGKNKAIDVSKAKLIGFEVNGKLFEPKYITSFYQLLWIKYLDNHKDLVEYANQFDSFHDIFRGKNSLNCQADVIAQYIKQGRASFFENTEMQQFLMLLKQDHQVRFSQGNLFTSDMDIYGHQTNCQGYMGKGIAKEVKSLYPKVYIKYKDICNSIQDKEKLLGRTLLLDEVGNIVNKQIIDFNSKIIANIFGQNEVSRTVKKTQEESVRKALIELKNFAQENYLWIGIPSYMGCRNGGGDWEVILKIIQEVFKDYPITLFNYENHRGDKMFTEKIEFTKEEAEFLYIQLASRKDYFQEEMSKGVESVERLNQLTFIMKTLDKGMKHFLSMK